MLGGYNSRPIRGSTTTPSNHSWGLALDINWDKNPMTSTLITDMPGTVVNAWKDLGFGWGGNYGGRKDSMHYEYNGTPQDAARRIAALTGQPAQPPSTPPTGGPGRCSEAHPLLQAGARGRPVNHLQYLLNRTGAGLDGDGDFGAKTLTAVRHFQSHEGLGADGKVGPQTWGRLHSRVDRLTI